MSYSGGRKYVFQSVEILNCPMLRMKPPLPKAEYWEISDSDNVLSSLEECAVSQTNGSSSSSPVTISMSVQFCKGPHQWRLLQHFPGLSSLSIQHCGDLTGLQEITRHLSSVETLRLGNENMKELPKWLGEITSLHNLEIWHGNGVKELNQNMMQLNKLESLKLFFCNNISLPNWLGELISLKELEITFNNVLRFLPESIRQLTSLQKIEIGFCDRLEHVAAESEEGKMKFIHSQERVCVLPTSLRELSLRHCKGIKSLPEGIQQLTNLQDLCIIACPELEHWCELEENKMNLAHIQNKCFASIAK